MTTEVFTQYHLRTPFETSWKLIQHIRYLHNEKWLKRISHEGKENGDTYVCIMLKPKTTLKSFSMIMEHLASIGLKAI